MQDVESQALIPLENYLSAERRRCNVLHCDNIPKKKEPTSSERRERINKFKIDVLELGRFLL